MKNFQAVFLTKRVGRGEKKAKVWRTVQKYVVILHHVCETGAAGQAMRRACIPLPLRLHIPLSAVRPSFFVDILSFFVIILYNKL